MGLSLTEQPDLFTPSSGLSEATLCHPSGSRGFFAHLVKDGRTTRQRSYRIDHLPVVIDQADPAKDNYISQAEFFRPNRRVVNLLRLNLNFIDLDFYAIDPGRERFAEHRQMAWVVRYFCEDERIPPPSLIAFSGRGLYLKWLYEGAIPRQAVLRWNALQRRLVELFTPFGADARAKDASRILRLMGTTNTKSGEVVRVLHVETENGEPKRYGFDWLAYEILETDRGAIAKARRQAKADREARDARRRLGAVEGERAKGDTSGLRRFSPTQLHWDRLEDLRKLATLRGWTEGGIPKGHRETYLFWSANFMLSSGATHPGQMFHEVTALAREVCPGSGMDAEVRSSLSTVYRKGLAHVAGERVEFNGKKHSPLYTPRNQTLIDHFSITREEERQLQTIISEEEAAERHRKRNARSEHSVDRASYIESAEMKRAEARLLRAKGMKQREIAAEMGVSLRSVKDYLKSDI